MLPLLLMTIVLIAGFWALIIRPQQQARQSHRDFVDTLAPGDPIEAFSGIRGTIAEVGDDTVGVEIAPGVVITMAKLAISARVEPPAEPTGPADDRTDVNHEVEPDVTRSPGASAPTPEEGAL